MTGVRKRDDRRQGTDDREQMTEIKWKGERDETVGGENYFSGFGYLFF